MLFCCIPQKINNYNIISKNGNIIFGMDRKTGKKVVLKKYKPQIESEVLLNLHHPNIIEILSCFSYCKKNYIVMEYGGEQDLFDYMISNIPLSLVESRYISRQILLALEYLHSKGISHRDIKPENLVITMNDSKIQVKLIDFDYATTDKIMNRTCGTLYYISPEVIEGKKYNKKCDIWSVGVIVFLFIFGKFPFQGNSDNETMKQIRSKDLNLSGVDNDECRFISGLLERDINLRLNAKSALEHDWLR